MNLHPKKLSLFGDPMAVVFGVRRALSGVERKAQALKPGGTAEISVLFMGRFFIFCKSPPLPKGGLWNGGISCC